MRTRDQVSLGGISLMGGQHSHGIRPRLGRLRVRGAVIFPLARSLSYAARTILKVDISSSRTPTCNIAGGSRHQITRTSTGMRWTMSDMCNQRVGVPSSMTSNSARKLVDIRAVAIGILQRP
jgi:hypothetical protein